MAKSINHPLSFCVRLFLLQAVLPVFFLYPFPAGAFSLNDPGPGPDSLQAAQEWYDFSVVNIYPHDPDAFTQGLLFRDGYLYESTGRTGRSGLRKVRLETGKVIQQHALENRYFGEGLTDRGDQLIQITLSSGTGFVYDLHSFAVERTFRYGGEGWGIVYDGTQFILSDGTPELRFLDAGTFEENGRITVTDNGQPVRHINELEMVGDRIFANVLFSDEIIIIDPANGLVTGRVDLHDLRRSAREDPANVLNGIAYDPASGRLFVTGKLWSKLFEIRLHPRN